MLARFDRFIMVSVTFMVDPDFERFCQDIVSAVDVEREVSVSLTGKIIARNDAIRAFCPFCQTEKSKTQKLHFYLPAKNWKCHKCGEGGNFIGFFVKRGELFRDVATRLARKYGIELPPNWQQSEVIQGSEKNSLPQKGREEHGVGEVADTKASKCNSKKQRIKLPAVVEGNRTDAMLLLEKVWGRMELSEKDQEQLFQKRGLEYQTSIDLGFRSNPRANERIIAEESSSFSINAKVSSGLFQWSGRRIVISRQFYGYGMMGSYRDKDTGEKKMRWGWVHPIIIPYFDASGSLVSMRPHKGGAKKGRVQRSRLYVPRRKGEGTQFEFEKVVITESEFKCAALWQMLGEGSKQTGNGIWGVCGVPGIQQIQNVAIENELIDYLEEVGPHEIVIVFDNEDKGDPSLKGYNENFEQRFDSIIYARVLMEKLGKRFPIINVKAGMLPDEWRDENGKADWDGVLARMASGGLTPTRTENI